MKVSTKGIYAVRFLLCLTTRGDAGPLAIKEASSMTGISKKYLEQIVPNLVSAKLVRSVRGATGGYYLAKRSDEISVYDVLQVTESTMAPVSCLEGDTFACTFDAPCLELGMWRGLDDVIRQYLQSQTLQRIVDSSGFLSGNDYSI